MLRRGEGVKRTSLLLKIGAAASPPRFAVVVSRKVSKKATVRNKIRKMSDYKPTSRESDAMAKDMKKRGFKFLGSTVCYAHMQAVGMVNDHFVDCFRYKQCL